MRHYQPKSKAGVEMSLTTFFWHITAWDKGVLVDGGTASTEIEALQIKADLEKGYRVDALRKRKAKKVLKAKLIEETELFDDLPG